jgi:hypothetical protein
VIIVQNPGNPSRPTVLLFDPLGGTPEKRRLVRRVLQMTGIYLAPVIGDLSTWVQVDGFTCGSWMVAAAETITSGVETGAPLTDIKKALRALAAGMKDRHTGNLKKFGR